MSDLYILDKDKNVIPATLMEWGEFLENAHKERIVKITDINDLRISTVFLGIDPSFDRSLHIFETRIFKKSETLEYCEHYSTWKEAEKGHRRAIKWVKNGCRKIIKMR